MKIRQGFVSNSSSSSFVVNGKKYANTVEVAKAMVPVRDWDGDSQLCRLLRELGVVDFNRPIAFRSCNYDTFISKNEDGNYYVFTCNNHSFSDALDVLEYDVDWELEEEIKTSTQYYWPEYDCFAWPVDHDEFMEKKVESYCREKGCWMEVMRDVKGNLFCPACKKVYWESNQKADLTVEQEARLVKFFHRLHSAMHECGIKSFATGDSDGNDHVTLKEGICIGADIMKCEYAQQLVKAPKTKV